MDETLTIEDRQYVNPEVSRKEQLGFIDNLRNLQQQANQQIVADTAALGTQVPSNLGGLTGAERTWTARYQTPQVESQIANLKQQAQQTALNTALQNQQNMWTNRYTQAQRELQAAQRGLERTKEDYYARKRKEEEAKTTSSGGTSTGEVDVVTNNEVSVRGTITARPGERAIASPWVGDDGNPINYVFNENNELVRLDGVVNRGSSTYNNLKKMYPKLVD